MNEIRFVMPFPPSVNHYWRTISKGKLAGRTLISKRGREYREASLELIDQQRVIKGLSNRLRVEIYMHPPCRRKRDVDNYLKGPLDAITHAGVWLDDEQVDDLRIVRGEKCPKGQLVVLITVIE